MTFGAPGALWLLALPAAPCTVAPGGGGARPGVFAGVRRGPASRALASTSRVRETNS